jgi:hypothetical protein
METSCQGGPEGRIEMKCRLLGLIGVATLIVVLVMLPNHGAAGPSATSIEKILSATESYDGKEVSVPGKVSNLKLRASKRGNSYTTFSLSGNNGRASLNVYSRGHAQVKEGQAVKVTGI